MLRKIACAVFVLVMAATLVSAEEFLAKITKIDGSKVTLIKGEKQGKKTVYEGAAKDFTLAKDPKILKGAKKGEPGEPLPDGLKNDIFAKIDAEKGVTATVVTNADNQITEIRLKGGKKKKNNQ
jgi:hypothetical protein